MSHSNQSIPSNHLIKCSYKEFHFAVQLARLNWIYFFICLKSLNIFIEFGIQEERTPIVIH